jgi:ADP-dependent NAD(P)H-hydrate dehydratase / NAD(P)H-hydrate epimerase
VAIDVPSGVRGDSGATGEAVVRARRTVTFDAKKPAHLLHPAASACGEVHVAEIGLAPFLAAASGLRLVENGPAQWAGAWPWPDTATHKHRRGRLVVVSGGIASTGAARLAAQAGLRIGAGLVTLLCPRSALAVAAAQLTAVMVRPFGDAKSLAEAAEGAHAAVIGPAAGVDVKTLDHVGVLASRAKALVLDADALTVLASSPGELEALAAEVPCVLTPHAGEFERLFPGLLGASASKVEAVREAARRSGAVVLLKGPDTVIANPGGRAAINVHASAFLATAGSGDVLAGVIGGLLAQGMGAFEAACAGAWIHGDAGRRAGPGLTAEDLDGALRESLRDLHDAGWALRQR